MRRLLSDRPLVAIVISLIGLFFAIGGTAVAATGGARQTHAGSADPASSILGTWNALVYDTPTAPPDHGLITFTSSHSVLYDESDVPTTAQGAWKQVGRHRFVLEFRDFLFTPADASNGWALVRAVVTLKGNSFSGSFKFDIFNTAGHLVQSDTGTETGTRFVIRPL